MSFYLIVVSIIILQQGHRLPQYEYNAIYQQQKSDTAPCQASPSPSLQIMLRQSSVAKGSNSSTQLSNFRKIRKFTFSDLSLSYQVRKKLYEMLISFDENVNYEFEKDEIRLALIEILDETEQEVAYVINNVFRYDLNHDGLVTYEEFSNFCLEQHFGEMAIQRLHKTGVYTRGRQRLMERKQFFKTVEYCLSFISIKPSETILNTIFDEIDLDKDNYIAYAQYFTFLKQYFGSQSQSASVITVSNVEQKLKQTYGNIDKKVLKQQIFKQKIHKKQQQKIEKPQIKVIKPPPPPPPPVVLTPSVVTKPTQQMLSLGQRISRLIYQQLKIITMQLDHDMILCSDHKNANQILTSIIKVQYSKAKLIISEAFQSATTTSYQNLVKYAIERVMCEDVVEAVRPPITKQRFVAEIYSNMHFLKAKPFSFLLQQLYDKYSNGKKQINKQQLRVLMQIIFTSYKWPRKTGQLRSKSSVAQNTLNYNQRLTRF